MRELDDVIRTTVERQDVLFAVAMAPALKQKPV